MTKTKSTSRSSSSRPASKSRAARAAAKHRAGLANMALACLDVQERRDARPAQPDPARDAVMALADRQSAHKDAGDAIRVVLGRLEVESFTRDNLRAILGIAVTCSAPEGRASITTLATKELSLLDAVDGARADRALKMARAVERLLETWGQLDDTSRGTLLERADILLEREAERHREGAARTLAAAVPDPALERMKAGLTPATAAKVLAYGERLLSEETASEPKPASLPVAVALRPRRRHGVKAARGRS
jgi:hypothetical protein